MTESTRTHADEAPSQHLDYRILYGALPLVAFWIGYQWGPYVAIGLGFAATIAAYFLSHRRGIVGMLALFGLVVATGAAIAGIILEDERAYLARDAASDFLIAAIAIGTVLVRRPLLGIVVREMSPPVKRLLPPAHRAFVWATLVLAAVNVFQGIVRSYMLLGGLTVGQYLVFSRLFGWPTAIVMFIAIAVIIRRAVDDARDAAAAEQARRTQSGCCSEPS
jgi:hypothetical protein